MGLLALKRAVSNRLIAYHEHTPGLRKFPFAAVVIITVLVFANALIWVAVGILLVWPPRHFAFVLLADAVAALSCVRNPGRVHKGKSTESNFHRALISTAVLSYTFGLRHALDADHISVRTHKTSWRVHKFLIEDSGNRFDDSSTHSIRATSRCSGNFLLSWSFNVRLFYSSQIARFVYSLVTAH